jgi:hypothetical protein
MATKFILEIKNVWTEAELIHGLEEKPIEKRAGACSRGFLYSHKKAKDCLVNPLHPNDWLARWYTQEMIALVK